MARIGTRLCLTSCTPTERFPDRRQDSLLSNYCMAKQYEGHSTSYRRPGLPANEAMKVFSHILTVREKLARAAELVDKNLRKAKAQQKLWYNRNAQSREFTRPQRPSSRPPPNLHKQVLSPMAGSLPRDSSHWLGRLRDRYGRSSQAVRDFHVNMLKKWCVPVVTSYFGDEGTEEADDIITWRDEADEEELVINKELTVQQKLEL